MGSRWKCLLCGRDCFDRPHQPHRCVGGMRKRFRAAAKALGLASVFVRSEGRPA